MAGIRAENGPFILPNDRNGKGFSSEIAIVAVAILCAGSLQEAVKKAAEAAGPGDIVSLSPACASFDMFPNYGTRGRRFKELVNAL